MTAAGVQRAASPAEVARAVDRTLMGVVRTLPYDPDNFFHLNPNIKPAV